jgi:putative ABC transport system permease protein
MLKNYITIALRNLLRQKGFTIINILGLTIGLTVSALIILYIVHELGYDRFHENAGRIYRVAINGEISGQAINVAVSSPPFGPALVADYPEVVDYTRIDPPHNSLFAFGDEKYYEDDILFVDSSFFKIFTVPLLYGDPATALEVPRSLVLTESLARKYFGDEYPVGKVLRYNDQTDLTVTGVCEDYPDNSHFTFQALVSYSTLLEMRGEWWMNTWGNFAMYNYIMLDRRANLDSLMAKMPDFLVKYMSDEIQEADMRFELYLQPVTSIHLHSNLMAEIGDNSDISYIYILMAITLFILILASINFMNLSTAKSANRAREVGIRKVAGSSRQHLVRQFIGESVIISLISLFITFFLIELILPAFNNITGKELDMQYILDWQLTLGFILLAVIVGIFAGSYPAFYLSAFNPIRVLQGRLKAGSSNSLLRNVLVFIQFTVSIALIIGTVVIYRQLTFMRKKDLGFDPSHVVIVPLRNEETRNKGQVIKEAFLTYPNVLSASLSSGLPAGQLSGTAYFPEGYGDRDPWLIYGFAADPDFIDKTMKMKIINGRNFNTEFSTDSTAVLINEVLLKKLAWEDPIGKIINSDRTPPTPYRIIGVIRDFHIQSLHQQINPIMIRFLRGQPNYLIIKLLSDSTPLTLLRLENAWEEINPEIPFDFHFLNERIDQFYANEKKMGNIFVYFTIFALFIAALGLYGLASFIAEQRTKEIGIRKAMGSSISKIAYILSRDFAKPVLLANLVAWPLAWFAMNKWLQNFSFRTDLALWIFPAAALVTLLLSLITVNIQTIRAASANPIYALRYE